MEFGDDVGNTRYPESIAAMLSCVGPLLMYFMKLFHPLMLTLISVLWVLGFTAIASLFAMRQMKKVDAFEVILGESKEKALAKLANIELGRIWIFPSKFIFKVSDQDWVNAIGLGKATLADAFRVTMKIPYLLIGFLVLSGVYLGITGDFGPRMRMITDFDDAGVMRVFAIFISTWVSSVLIYLGLNRLYFRFGGDK